MTAKILGRITKPDQPRGPDVEFRVSVPEEWIAEGATLEIELPRNLACAACGGGGCDACERSGAVSLRGRQEPTEIVEITLPKFAKTDDAPPSRTIVMRVPEHGGLPPKDSTLPRGHLLLAITPGPETTRGVERLKLSRKLSTMAPRTREPLFGGQGRFVIYGLIVAAVLAYLLTRFAGVR